MCYVWQGVVIGISWQIRDIKITANSHYVCQGTNESNISVTRSGNVAPPNSPGEPEDATSSSSNDNKLHVPSDVSSKASSRSVMVCKPMPKSQLGAEAWRPSYDRSLSPSVGNDLHWTMA